MVRRFAASPVALLGVIAVIGLGAVLVVKSGMGLHLGGPETVAARVQTPAPFTSLTVNGPIKVILADGDPKVRLEGGDELLQDVTVTVKDGDLVIAFAGDGQAAKPLAAAVQGRGIDHLRLDGAAALEASGGLAPYLAVDASGAATVTLKGDCETLVLDLKQAARAALGKFDCRSVKARLDHAAWAEVSARDQLDAAVGGIAELLYHGKPPKVAASTSADGRIRAAP